MSEVYRFRFATWDLPPAHLYAGQHRLRGHVKVTAPFGELRPASRCWVYVFERSRDGDAQQWTREVWVDEEGRCCLVLADDALDPAAHPRPPDEGGFVPTPTGEVMLIDAYPDEEPSYESFFQYRFLASRQRLPGAVLQEVLAAPPAEVARLEWELLPLHLGSEHEGHLYIRVLEPLAVLAGLQEHFAGCRQRWIEWEIPAQIVDEIERRRAEARQQKLTLAGSIQNLFEQADDPDALRACVVGPAFDGLLRDARATRDALHGACLAADETIVTWLNTDFMRFAQLAHFEAGAMPDFLEAWAHGVQGLGAHEPGRDFLDGLLQDQQGLVRVYALPTAPPPGDVVNVTRKCAGPLIDIVENYLPVVARRLDDAHDVLARVNLVSPRGALVLSTTPTTIKVDRGGVLVDVTLPRTLVPDEPGIAAWISQSLKRPPEGAALAAKRLGTCLEVLNLTVAVQDAFEQGQLDGDGVLNLLGSTTDLIASLEFVFKEAVDVKRFFLVVNIVSGVIDTYLAARGFYDERCHSDDSVAVGQAMVALGSGLGVIASGWALAATVPAFAISGPPGWVLFGCMVLIGAGTLLSTLTQDTPLETYLLHCEWGTSAGRATATQRPNWSPRALRDLKGDYPCQLEALLNLFRSYVVACGDYPRGNELTLHPGLLEAGAAFEVELRCQLEVRHSPSDRETSQRWGRWRFTWGQTRVEQLAGDPWPHGVGVEYLPGDRPGAVFTAYPGTSPPGVPQVGDVTVQLPAWRVRLDLGDGARWLPQAGWIGLGQGETTSFAGGTIVP